MPASATFSTSLIPRRPYTPFACITRHILSPSDAQKPGGVHSASEDIRFATWLTPPGQIQQDIGVIISHLWCGAIRASGEPRPGRRRRRRRRRPAAAAGAIDRPRPRPRPATAVVGVGDVNTRPGGRQAKMERLNQAVMWLWRSWPPGLAPSKAKKNCKLRCKQYR